MPNPLPAIASELFFTDLDSTMIFSHRHPHDADCVWVEELNGKQQSFMTRKSFRFFQMQNRFRIVPLTTRSFQQFSRLRCLTDTMGWQDALICNGAVRLCGEQEDLQWRSDSENLAAPHLQQLLSLKRAAANLCGTDAIVSAEPFLFYVKAADRVAEVTDLLLPLADPKQIIIFHDARKVYCIPQTLSKGAAAMRYAKLFADQPFWAAGDGELDIPMLNAASVRFCSPEISSRIRSDGQTFVCHAPFSDTVCDLLDQMSPKEI